jgi:hypothetical protein
MLRTTNGFVLGLLPALLFCVTIDAQPATQSVHPPAEQVIAHLDRTIDWYRRVGAVEQATGSSQERRLSARTSAWPMKPVAPVKKTSILSSWWGWCAGGRA